MKSSRIVVSLLFSAAIISTAVHVSWGQAPPLPSLPAGDAGDDDTEVYTRGTLHEAFAVPVSNEVVVPPVVQKEPPPPVEELPPEQQPEGENVTWISGYWAWDEDLDDYIWISGLWRDVPPGRQWIPGYWAQTPQGYQWVAGMWNEVGQTTISYLPTPPQTLERGPQIQAPGADYFYVPGCWEYRDRYVWRAGYWAPRQRDWIWIPSHYVYTPYGCCFVAGHWDLLLVDRGLCYAPVRFHRPRPAFVYRPVIVIDTWDTLAMHLWVDPRRGCYAYGNYYDAPPNRYVPWYDYRGPAGRGDPLFAYYEWRNGPEYRTRLSGWHNHFVAHRDFRPPATYREQVRYVEKHRSNTNINLNLAIDVRKIDRDRDRDHDVRLPVALKQVSREDDTRFREQAKSWVTAAQTRRQVETEKVGRIADAGKPDRGGRPQEAKQVQLELPKAVAAVSRQDVARPETPDKLRDVKPDKPRGDEVRVPSRTKEHRIAQEQTLKRDRPDARRGDLATPADVPPPPPGRNTGEQASKDENDRKKPDPRDAFGLDSPGRDRGRDNMPERQGRAQNDSRKPDADARQNEAPSRTPRPSVGQGDNDRKPDRRDDPPNTDSGKPDRTPSNTPPTPSTTPRPNRLPSTTDRMPDATPRTDRTPNSIPRTDRTPNSIPKTDRTPNSIPRTDRSLPPDQPPRRLDDGKTDRKTDDNTPPRDRGRSDERPGKMDNDRNPPRGNAPDPTPRRIDNPLPRSIDRSPSNPSTDRKQNPPRTGNQPPRNSGADPNRKGDPRNDRPKTTVPERKPAPKSDSKEKKDKDEDKKEKDKKPS
jgi:hypothetical protein